MRLKPKAEELSLALKPQAQVQALGLGMGPVRKSEYQDALTVVRHAEFLWYSKGIFANDNTW